MSKFESKSPREVAREVLEIEAAAVHDLLDQLDERFDSAIALLVACKGRVVCTGIGKSGLVMQKIAATLSSTGTPALFLHPADAIHGDLGMITDSDLVLAASYSGTTQELQRLAELVRRLGVGFIVMTGNADSPLARNATVHLPVEIDQEACPLNLAPTASSTATLAMGDALAMALLQAKGFTRDDFARLHPGGSLGKGLVKLRELMHTGAEVPRVDQEVALKDAVREISAKGMGITAVTGPNRELLGCITDGDLRRRLASDGDMLDVTAGDCMGASPLTIAADELAAAALKTMEDNRITALFVCEGDKLEGIVHLHDLWRIQLF
ncbi:MAG: KpsF/GutQ family sugar-phosphate isomerase [Acidobacteria bacterium]|nr:KpsF/GutQ family sugar-phosphate isomerase [Acidobacteriota bacterium]